MYWYSRVEGGGGSRMEVWLNFLLIIRLHAGSVKYGGDVSQKVRRSLTRQLMHGYIVFSYFLEASFSF